MTQCITCDRLMQQSPAATVFPLDPGDGSWCEFKSGSRDRVKYVSLQKAFGQFCLPTPAIEVLQQATYMSCSTNAPFAGFSQRGISLIEYFLLLCSKRRLHRGCGVLCHSTIHPAKHPSTAISRVGLLRKLK